MYATKHCVLQGDLSCYERYSRCCLSMMDQNWQLCPNIPLYLQNSEKGGGGFHMALQGSFTRHSSAPPPL